MVAPNHDTPSANLDPGESIQGHNGEKQIFVTRRSWLIQDRKSKRQAREFIVEDQFGNTYVVYRAKLHDGEEYDVRDWVAPSTLLQYGGFTDALIDDYRAKAFQAFKDKANEINAMRSLASSIGYQGDASKLVIPTEAKPDAQ
jgi:hypothetical protein